MKPQELAYGNLVTYLGRTHVIESPNATKTWASPILKNGTLGAVELLDNDKIEPLPITAENLALLRFAVVYRSDWANNRPLYEVEYLPYSEFYCYNNELHGWYLNGGKINYKIDSIHNLQNISQSVYKITLQYNAPQP